MGQGPNIGGGAGFDTLYEAMKQAIIDAGGGGGGGAAFPDAIVTGSGAYVIPVGFNGKVISNVKAGESFTVNGFTVLASDSFNSSWNTIIPSNNMFLNTAAGQTANLLTSSSTLVPANRPVFTTDNASTQDKNNVSASYSLLEGDVINGGRYVVELYAI